jgi:hypothetical protein
MAISSKFGEIIEKAIDDAEAVDCDPEEFQVGLALMWHKLDERLELEGIDPRDEEVLTALNDEE